jgi:hypothetical protein
MFPFLLSVFYLSRWTSIAHSYRIPTLVPTICVLERTPTKCHPKGGLEKSSDRRLISSGRSSGPQNNPNNHPTTNIHRASYSSSRNQNTRRAAATTSNPSGDACYEHLRAKYLATNATSRDRSSRGSTARLRRRDRSNHRG